jgi:hypothetical protein
MRTPAWYADWRAQAFEQLQAKQAMLKREFNFGQWRRYDYDLDKREITFSDEKGVALRGDFQVAGTTNGDEWLWGWANRAMPPEALEDALKTRAFGEERGIDELTSEFLPNSLDWMMTAVVVQLTDALGAYRSTGDPRLFMTIRSLEWARSN